MSPDPPSAVHTSLAASPTEVIRRLLEGVARVINGHHEAVEEIIGLYANHTHVTHPMSHRTQAPLTTREELRAHFAPGPQDRPIPGFRAVNPRVHETGDPEVVVAEFSWATDNASFPCVFVTRVRDGLIVESRDYVDHAASAKLFSDS